MTEEVPNPFLVLALGKLEIPIKDYKNHPKFQALPEKRDDPAYGMISRTILIWLVLNSLH